MYDKIKTGDLMKTFKDNADLIKELKKLMIDTKTTQKTISKELGIVPQSFTSLLNKKNLSFLDIQKILSVMGYELGYEFIKENRNAPE